MCDFDLDMHHFEIEQAFVQSQLDGEIFVRLPPGVVMKQGPQYSQTSVVCFYGLKQASRTRNAKLVHDLKTMGFEQCSTDPCVFRVMDGALVEILLVVHVDDVLLLCDWENCGGIHAALTLKSQMNNLG